MSWGADAPAGGIRNRFSRLYARAPRWWCVSANLLGRFIYPGCMWWKVSAPVECGDKVVAVVKVSAPFECGKEA